MRNLGSELLVSAALSERGGTEGVLVDARGVQCLLVVCIDDGCERKEGGGGLSNSTFQNYTGTLPSIRMKSSPLRESGHNTGRPVRLSGARQTF